MQNNTNLLIDTSLSDLLKNHKNLLAFSAGGDSVALFYLLLDNQIDFDISIVNYHTREQADEEVKYAKDLAKKYNKQCFVYDVEKITKNFEANARDKRYKFFENLIQNHGYQNLLTAHHLNDKLEWLLMQLSKGSGVLEILGFDMVENYSTHKLIRPLLFFSKEQILLFLKQNRLKYFEDKSNLDQSYKRNFFRHNFSNPIMKEFYKGIKKSFHYLHIDKELLQEQLSDIKQIKQLFYFKQHSNIRFDIHLLDKLFKDNNYLLSASQKEEIIKNKNIIIANKFVLTFYKDYIFFSKYFKTTMTKDFKEKCRVLKIPNIIRSTLFAQNIDIEKIILN